MIEQIPHLERRGTGLPVIFIHGNGVDHRMSLALDPAFATTTQFERVYVDLPGFGKTPRLPDGHAGLPELADWVDEALGHLVGTAPFLAVGTSLGGLLVREAVARRRGQCAGFALIAPVIDPAHASRTVPQPSLLREDAEVLASLSPADARDYTELAVIQGEENWARFRDEVLPGLRSADQSAMARLAENYELPTLPDARLAGFDRPVLIIAGRQDAVVGFEDQWQLARMLPHATFAVVDHAGHNLQVDQSAVVHALLEQWLARIAV